MTRRSAAAVLSALPASVRRRNVALAPVAAPARPVARTAAQRATAGHVAPVALPPGAVVVDVPGLLTKSEANQRAGAHWARTHRSEAAAAAIARAFVGVAVPRAPLRVCLTRRAPGMLDDDNAHGAMKSCRDAVAKRLGIDDGDPRVVWRVTQERTKRGVYGVRITLTPLDGRGRVETTDVADVVRVEVSRDQVDTAVRTLLDRRGGWMGFDVAGLSLRVWIEAAK